MKANIFLKFVLLFIFLGLSTSVNAQVGIGTDLPDDSSILDIESASKGVLIPRIALTGTGDTTTITTGNVESLLIYNTATVSGVEPGYYYWEGTIWVRLLAGADADTNIGNVNQTLTENRTVTQNAFDLNFDANTLVIDGSEDEVGIGTNNPAQKLDVIGNTVIGDGITNNTLFFRRDNGGLGSPGEIGYATGSNNEFSFSNAIGNGFYTFNTNWAGITNNERFRINTNGEIVSQGSAVFNEEGFRSNFRVEGETDEYMIFGSAGINRVGIGTNAPRKKLDVFGDVAVGDGINNNKLFIRRNNTPDRSEQFEMGFNPASINIFDFYSRVYGNGLFTFTLPNPLLSTPQLTIRNTGQLLTAGGAVINEEGQNQDFRVEGSTDENLIRTVAGTNRVGIGRGPGTKLDVNGSITLGDNADDNTLRFRGASGAVNAQVGYQTGSLDVFDFFNNRLGGSFLFRNSSSLLTIPQFTIMNTGATVTAAGAVINEEGLRSNFRVESETDENLIFGDARNSRVGIGTNAPLRTLDVNGQVMVRNLPDAVSTDQPLYADANGNIKRGSSANADWRLINAPFTSHSTNEDFNDPNEVTFRSSDNNVLSLNYDLSGIPHNQVKVEFTYWFLDTWDGEYAMVDFLGGNAWMLPYNNNIQVSGTFNNNTLGRVTGEHDQRLHGVTSGRHISNTLTIRVNANIDEATTDEGFAISNVTIWVK